MGTLTITASGFANLPATAPAGWPATITYPANGNPNGTKSYTITDADWQKLITWTAASQSLGTVTPTAAQILLAWVQVWANGTIQAVKGYFTQPATPPAPITFT